jgi:RNA polymerase primary sigma factor
MTSAAQAPRSRPDAAVDSLRRYLDEIGRFPLLTRSEEVRLAVRIEAGDPAARQRLVESNLRLVVAIARSFRASSVELLDLIQEGTLGLMRAVERYDWRRGTRFSTYAAWWIRHGVMQALAAGAHPIRLPESVRERVGQVERADRALAAALGRRPTVAEIADELGLTVQQVGEARAAATPVGSLDEPLGADREASYADVIADPNAPDPLKTLLDEVPAVDLEERLALLGERGRRVVELRYGLRDGEPRTVDAIGRQLGLSRERVRQIELNALRRLAGPVGVARAA